MVNRQTASDGEWALLEVLVPGLAPEPIGILLREVTVDRLYVRLRSEWWHILPDEQASELWGELADDLEEQARDIGAAETLDWLDMTASHTLQIGQRREVQVLDVKTTLDSLFRQNVCVSDGPTLKSAELARERIVDSSFHTHLRVVAAVAATVAVGMLLSQEPPSVVFCFLCKWRFPVLTMTDVNGVPIRSILSGGALLSRFDPISP